MTRAGGARRRLLRATGGERLLRGGLRHDLGFLVSHFWLLSEAFASLLFVQSPMHPHGQRFDTTSLLRAHAAKRENLHDAPSDRAVQDARNDQKTNQVGEEAA